MLKYVYILWLSLALSACAVFSGSLKAPQPRTLPLQTGAHWFHISDLNNGQQSLLAVQPQTNARWRWVQTDAFGAPLARQVVDARGWRNDGFAPPNTRASRLFAAMLAILGGDVSSIYPQFRVQALADNTLVYRTVDGREVWRIRTVNENEWQISSAAGERWQIRIIE